MQIVPIRDLKDTVKIENLCHLNKEPVFVTKNGYGSLVVMDIEYFNNLLFELEEAAAIDSGIRDIEQGKAKKVSGVLKDIKTRYGFR